MNPVKCRHTAHFMRIVHEDIKELEEIKDDLAKNYPIDMIGLQLAMTVSKLDNKVDVVFFGRAGACADKAFSMRTFQWCDVQNRVEELQMYGPVPRYSEVVFEDFQFTLAVISQQPTIEHE